MRKFRSRLKSLLIVFLQLFSVGGICLGVRCETTSLDETFYITESTLREATTPLEIFQPHWIGYSKTFVLLVFVAIVVAVVAVLAVIYNWLRKTRMNLTIPKCVCAKVLRKR